MCVSEGETYVCGKDDGVFVLWTICKCSCCLDTEPCVCVYVCVVAVNEQVLWLGGLH